jgi:hypothetical protein
MLNKELMILLITGVLYAMFIVGSGCLLSQELFYLYSKIITRKRLRKRKSAGQPEDWLDTHLRQLLLTTLGPKATPPRFKTATILLFVSINLAGYKTIAPLEAVIAGSVVAALPYLMLRIRLETIRRKSSYEGELLLSNILSQYRIRHHNIYEAVEALVEDSGQLKNTRKLLGKLLLELRGTGSEEIIRRAAQNFSYAINTNWSRMLANNIQNAAIKGVNISLAMEDILIQLREARTLVEERKRLNSEAVRMTIVMIPAMYIATVLMSIVYMDLPAAKFIHNQFYSTEGFTLFLLTFCLFLLNIMLIEIIRNQRFDF